MNGKWIREGVIGGVIAGIAMAMVAMMYTLVAQSDLLAPLKQMGALFFPNDSGSAFSMLAGMVLHMMTAAVLGLVFVLLIQGRIARTAPLAVAGMIYILVEWLIASYLILPAIDTALLATFATVGGFVAHAMYGVVLGWWLAWRVAPWPVGITTAARQHHAH